MELMKGAGGMEGCGYTRLEDARRRLVVLTEHNRALEDQLHVARTALQQSRLRITRLEKQLADEALKTAKVAAQLAELKESIREAPANVPPDFVKANISKESRKPPGQKSGHKPEHRRIPAKIDTHVEVPLPKDRFGKASCPACHCQLQDLKKHPRVVEDILPAKKIVTCYHTTSGYCPGCRKRVESKEKNQPPAPAGVEIHQPQLGINSLATAALLRMRYRLPYRQIEQLFCDLPGMSISAGGIAKQIQRMAGWLEGQYDRLKVLIRASPSVHMDETSWRVDGQNHWLWTMLSDKATVYHVDKSRGQKVTEKLLGEQFSGTLVSDFYSGYARIDCPKQKCLVHLLREIKETSQKHPAFGQGTFGWRLKRLVHQMLLLKQKKPRLARQVFEAKVRKLERRLLELEREPEGGWQDTHAKRLAKRLRGHEGELTTFLRDDQVAGTNNAAERALRPAVVARKISGGSRSEAGAKATAILLSVLRTAMQQGCPLFEALKMLLRCHWSGEEHVLIRDLFKKTG
jgi:hypothetical protein